MKPLPLPDFAGTSDADLLTVLLSNAKAGPHTIDEARALAGTLAAEFDNSLPRLAVQEPAALAYVGAPKRAAVILAAAFELGRQAFIPHPADAPLLNNPEAVYNYIRAEFMRETREKFVCIACSTSGRAITHRTLTAGVLSASLVDPRAVFRFALLHSAATVIVCHNHPSGKLDPSKEDIQITKDLVYAGANLDISVSDHVIVGPTGYLSMKNAGYV